jgi:hypothetical protein
MKLVHPTAVSKEQAAAFARNGALKLEGLVDMGAIAELRRLLARELGVPETARGFGRDGDYDGVKYGVGSTQELTRALVQSAEFRAVIHALVPMKLLLTQSNGFALGVGKAGLDWHFDLISFSYIQPLSPGYTLWLPLDAIDPTGQRGGIEYVPEAAYSGRDKMVLSSRHFHEGPGIIAELGGLEAYRKLMPCSPAEKVVLDRHRVEPAFALGDAFLFSRYVWHRSSPLLEGGPLTQRLALNLRLVAGDALYDRTLCKKFGEFSVAYGNPNVKTAFGMSFDDLADGDPMIRSRHAVDVI